VVISSICSLPVAVESTKASTEPAWRIRGFFMIENLIKAEQECTEWVDIEPDKILRPVGTTFDEWVESPSSTQIPHWVKWEVAGHFQSFAGRRGNVGLYRRREEIKLSA